MNSEAEETERRTDALVDSLEGRKTAIRELAQETKSEAEEMMKTYLEDEEEALDGFEFLTMAEAGELGHWEIVQTMAKTVGDQSTPPSSPTGRSGCSAVTSTKCARAASSLPRRK